MNSDRAAVLDQDPLRLEPRAQPRASGHRTWQVADVHAALGIDLAADGAGAALHAAAGVTGDRATTGADRGRSLHRELAVAAHPLRIDWCYSQELLGGRELVVQVWGPADAEALTPIRQHRIGGAEAGA